MMPLGLLGPGEEGEIAAVRAHKNACCGGCGGGCSCGGGDAGCGCGGKERGSGPLTPTK